MTTLIAQIAGPYLLITGLGFLISSAFYIKMVQEQAKASPVTLNLSGAVHFIVGMIILTNHFQWGSPLESAVTLLGVSAALKGAGLILIPDMLASKTNSISKLKLYISAVLFIALGCVFCYAGYLS